MILLTPALSVSLWAGSGFDSCVWEEVVCSLAWKDTGRKRENVREREAWLDYTDPVWEDERGHWCQQCVPRESLYISSSLLPLDSLFYCYWAFFFFKSSWIQTDLFKNSSWEHLDKKRHILESPGISGGKKNHILLIINLTCLITKWNNNISNFQSYVYGLLHFYIRIIRSNLNWVFLLYLQSLADPLIQSTFYSRSAL